MANYNRTLIAPISASWYKRSPDGTIYGAGQYAATAATSIESLSKSLEETPGWRQMKVKPVKSFRMDFSKFDNPIVSWANVDVFWDGNVYYHNGTAMDVLSYGGDARGYTLPDLKHVTNQASNQCLQNLNAAKSSTLVSLAEAGKTASHIGQTATRIADALRSLRKFDAVGVGKALGIVTTRRQVKEMSRLRSRWILEPGTTDLVGKPRRIVDRERYTRTIAENRSSVTDFFGDAWLEYSYGWRPLLSDVYSHAEALAHVMTEHQNLWIKASGRSQEHGTTHRKVIQNESRENTCIVEYNKRTQVVVMYSMENVNAANTFGLQNPLQVAWELVPFSFVVDWFLPIGNAIENMSATNGLTFHSGYISDKLTVKSRVYVQSRGPSQYNGRTRYPSGSGVSSLDSVSFWRTKLDTFPTATFPSFKDPRSFSHAASAIALLNSLFLSKR